MSTKTSSQQKPLTAHLRFLTVWGPGLLVMLADSDAGNVVTAAQAGAQWGYRLLSLLLLLIPLLYMVQELAVRLGIFTGRGHGELIRDCFGPRWAWLAVSGLAVAAIGSLITEFTGIAGIGDLYGISRVLTLPIAVGALLAVVLTRSYRRIERAAVLIGLFELAFFAVAWSAHPDPAMVWREVVDIPLGNRRFLYLAAALVGAVFNPWMVFYQQSAVADKKLTADAYKSERWDTAFGAVLTQLLTAAVLVAVASTLGRNGTVVLNSVGEISEALKPLLGTAMARPVFSAGVLGASMVAAIVSSLALAWGVGEVAGFQRSTECLHHDTPWFYGVYVACVIGSAGVVWLVPDLVDLNIAVQVLNAFLLPLVIGFLVTLSVKALPETHRLRGWYLWVVVGVSSLVCALGLVGGLSGFY
ncbi:MAG: divalent metal cation transporter [Alphaproteobacteria bacterium]|nr:divalent metal cation transporter [Alphaproteobacteria bacterium]